MAKTKEQISYNMRQIKSMDSKIELILRKTLWHRGIRYRKNVKTIFGHPDIAFIGRKLAVFVDSEFWHGFDWDNRKNDIKTNVEFFHGKDWEVLKPRLMKSNNSEYWISKISRNMTHDNEVNKALLFRGWTVIRFWGNDIKKNAEICADDVVRALNGDYSLCIGRVFRLP